MTEADKTAARNEIAELIQRYAHATDFNDREAYAQCFTEDGVLTLPGGKEHAGRPSLREMSTPDRLRRRHFFTPPVLTFVSDSEAHGSGYCLVYNYVVGSKEFRTPASVDYKAVYRKTAEGWRVARQDVTLSFAD